ncbi:DDE_3 domain-containing protein [Trichonephila clavipes]|uniref:DDE_3 domain-containing protein n=1 Tax=Trichonephila clavipes TaxID=2585209 RepID=A0A8X7BBL5_TRICX|nr:DDE_3 domain-containing protein [Trichonephila clavipes]
MDGVFEDNNAAIHARGLIQHRLSNTRRKLKIYLTHAVNLPHSIIEPLQSSLKRSIRNLYHFWPSLPELSHYLHEKWYNASLNAIKHLYESVPRVIQAVMHATGGPSPY